MANRAPTVSGKHLLRASCVLLIALTSISCGDQKCVTCPGDNREAPQRTITGWVHNAVFQPIEGAQVAVVGSRLSALTAADGTFELTGGIATPAAVRVTKDGYASETRAAVWPVCGPGGPFPSPCDRTRTSMFFTLTSLGPSVDVSGDWAVTLTADSSCTDLPSEARARTFTASFARTVPSATTYHATFQSPSLEPGGMFSAGVFGSSLVVHVDGFPGFGVPGLIDAIAPNRFVLSHGTVSATLTPDARLFSAVFDGTMAYCSLKPGWSDALLACSAGSSQLADPTPADPRPFTSCRSSNHRMQFAR